MAIGRISGSVLKSNLTRNGVDLAFETNLLYLDVTNGRVGIGTSEPSTALHVVGNATVTGDLFVSGAVSFATGAIDSINTGALIVDDNNITGTRSNEDIVLSASGTGRILLKNTLVTNTIQSDDSTAIQVNDALNVSGTLSADVLDVNEISSGDSTAIQVNDGLNIGGILISDNKITGSRSNENMEITPSGTGTIIVGSSIIPNANLTYDLGSATKRFNTLYVAGSTIDMGGTKLGVNNDGDFEVKNSSGTRKNIIGAALMIGHGADMIKITRSARGKLSMTDASDNEQSILTIVGDDSTGVELNTGETFKIAGGANITTHVTGDTLTISGSNPAQGITFVGDDSTGTRISDGESIKIAGAQNITTAMSGDVLTITGPDLSSYATTSYVDSQMSSTAITFVGDDSTGTAVNSGETIKIAGTQNITTAVSGDTLTITGPDLSSYLTSIPKTIDVNTIASTDSSVIQINDGVRVSGTIDVQGNSIVNVQDPTAAQDVATKNYVDSQLSSYTPTGSGITFVGDDSTGNTVLLGDTLKITGAGSITTSVNSDGTLTITGANAAQGITFVGDDSTGTRISDGETVKITGTQNITTAVSGDVLTITGPDLSSYLTSIPKTIDVNVISSSDSTAIQVNDAVNISGQLTASGIKYPTADGSVDQIMTTDGFGNIAFRSINDLLEEIDGGDANSIQTSSLTVDYINVDGNTISATNSNGDIIMVPNGSGSVVLDGQYWPQSDGTNGQVLTTNGSGQLSWSTVSGSGIVSPITFVGDDSTGTAVNVGETFKIAGGTGITTAVSGDTLTITATGGGGSAQGITFVGDDSTGTRISDGETIKFVGAGGATVSVSGDIVTITAGTSSGDVSHTDDENVTIFYKTGIGLSSKLIRNTLASSERSAMIYEVIRDEVNNKITAQKVSMLHDDSDVYLTVSGKCTNANNTNNETTHLAEIEGDYIKYYITGASAVTSASFYKIGLNDDDTNDSNGKVDIIVEEINTTGVSVLDSWAATGYYRAAKYFISIQETSGENPLYQNMEAMLVHNGSDAYVTSYNIFNNDNNNLFTFSADINTGQARLKVNSPGGDFRFVIHRILLADNETNVSKTNQSVIGATSVSTVATTVDTFDNNEITGAFYYIAANDGTNYSMNEVMVVSDEDDAYVVSGPVLSNNGLSHLTFSASLSGNTVSLKASGSYTTTVVGYRINLLREETGNITQSEFSIAADNDPVGSTINTLGSGELLTITGSNNISTSISGNTITVTGDTSINVNEISSSDSTAIQINDGVNISGTLTSANIVNSAISTNKISSTDSSAIQLDAPLIIDGQLGLSNNRITNVSDPIASQDVATKAYVDSQTSSFVSEGYDQIILLSQDTTDFGSAIEAAATLTANRTITLPDVSGTIVTTTDTDTVTSTMLDSPVRVRILDSSGTILKTIYGAGA